MSLTAPKSSGRRWLERLGLADRADALVQELSGGNQQRVQLAVSLVHEPDPSIPGSVWATAPLSVLTFLHGFGFYATAYAAVDQWSRAKRTQPAPSCP